MKSILLILNEAIVEIRPVYADRPSKTPEPIPGQIWILIPKSKSRDLKLEVANKQNAVWVAFQLNYLESLPKHCKKSKRELLLKFQPEAARLYSKGESVEEYTAFDLTNLCDYSAFEKCDEVILVLPLSSVIFPPCPVVDCCPIKDNRTVYVDVKYGNDYTGQLDNPCKPFRSINRAIIRARSVPLLSPTGFLVIVNPGIYEEVVEVGSSFRILGSGVNRTIIRGLKITGSGDTEVDQLSIIPKSINIEDGLTWSAIFVNLSSENINRNVLLNNLAIDAVIPLSPDLEALSIVALKQSTGIDGIIRLNQLNIDVDATQFAASHLEVIRVEGVEAQLVAIASSLLINPTSTAHQIFGNDARVIQRNGSSRHQIVNAFPTYATSIWKFEESSFEQNDHSLTGLITAVEGGKSQLDNRITLYYSENSTITGSGTEFHLDGVPQNLLVGAFAANENSPITLNSLNFMDTYVPTFIAAGATFPPFGSIKYFTTSQDGNQVGNGGLYANASRWSNLFPDVDEAYVQDNTHLMVMDLPGKTLLFENPSIVGQEVAYLGKIVHVKNRSGDNVFLDGTIFDKVDDQPITVIPKEGLILQNDGLTWYIIARYLP